MDRRGEIGLAEVLILTGAIMILVWALLKGFGVINTPLLVQMVPYIGGAVSLLGVVAGFGKLLSRFDSIGRGVARNGRNIEGVREKVDRIDREFVKVRNNQELCLSGKLKSSPYG
jgi:hypothetical protein